MLIKQINIIIIIVRNASNNNNIYFQNLKKTTLSGGISFIRIPEISLLF